MGYALESGVTDTSGRSIVTLPGVISSGNTTNTPLNGNGVFTGTAEDTLNYSGIILFIATDKDSAVDGLSVEFSGNGTTDWHVSDVFSIFAGDTKTFSFQPVERYIRIKYTNGPVTQTHFDLTLTLKTTAPKPSSHRVEESISTEDDAELVKAVLTGQTPYGDYDTVKMDSTGALNIAFGDSANLDAFSRLRTSSPDTVFDSTFQYDLQPLIYETKTAASGGVAHNAAKVAAVLTTAASPGSSAIIQTRNYHRYIPGKGQLILMTGNFGAGVANIVKRAGYFDANDGIFYEQNGTEGLRIVRRTNVTGTPTDNIVEQADWNLDTLDGLGRSGIDLNPEKVYILVIEMQWLGMGRVRVGFDIDGRIYPAHEFRNANNLATVYMKTANLPVRWEIAGNGVGTMDAVCSSVQSEGGADKFLGYQFAYNRAVVTAASGTQTHAFSIRPKATFNSITNRSLVRPTSFDCMVTGNYPVLIEVYHNTTMGGSPSWSDLDATYSALQVDTAGTPSGGVKAMSFWASASTAASSPKTPVEKNFSARYPLTLDIAGTGYTNMTVYVTGIGGASTCYPGMGWEETR